MVAQKSVTFCAAERLSHDEACRLAELSTRSKASKVILDLSRSREASTAAFARIVLLRRDLLQVGRDLCITGLRGRAASLFEVHRLQSVLPCVLDTAPAPAPQPRPSRRAIERTRTSPAAALV